MKINSKKKYIYLNYIKFPRYGPVYVLVLSILPALLLSQVTVERNEIEGENKTVYEARISCPSDCLDVVRKYCLHVTCSYKIRLIVVNSSVLTTYYACRPEPWNMHSNNHTLNFRLHGRG